MINYRIMMARLNAGVQFMTKRLGEAYGGVIALGADALAEGSRLAFLNALPGHPEQAEDALNQVGSDRSLFRYRDETMASWGARIRNSWLHYEQQGTDIQVLRALDEWGGIVFPGAWTTGKRALVEGQWARFIVFVLPTATTWGPALHYDDPGATYDAPNLMYDVSGFAEDVTTFSRIVRKWKPKRSKGTGIVVLSGHVYDEPALTYDGGSVYGDGTETVVRIQL